MTRPGGGTPAPITGFPRWHPPVTLRTLAVGGPVTGKLVERWVRGSTWRRVPWPQWLWRRVLQGVLAGVAAVVGGTGVIVAGYCSGLMG